MLDIATHESKYKVTSSKQHFACHSGSLPEDPWVKCLPDRSSTYLKVEKLSFFHLVKERILNFATYLYKILISSIYKFKLFAAKILM